MALLKFNHGPVDRLPIYSSETVGNIYITKDSHEMKVDLPDGRISISDFIIVENQAALEALGTYYENLFYYVKAGNILQRCTKSVIEGEVSYTWTKINDVSELERDLGALGNKVVSIERAIDGYEENGAHVNGIKEDITSLKTAVAGINASTVETTQDIVVTAAVGNYAKGKVVKIDDIQEIIKNMLSTDIPPSVTTNISASLTLNQSGAKEVGTEVTPSFSFSTNKGAYSQYRDPDTGTMKNQDTGVVFSNFAVEETGRPAGSGDNGSSTSSSGSFAKFTVTDALTSSAPYKLTGSCDSSEGNVPKSYLGVEDSSKKIAAKDWDNLASGTIYGYRAMFYGYFNSKAIADPTAITSAQVRALSGARLKSGTTYETKTGPQTTLPSGAKAIKTNKMQQMFFAAPKGKYSSIAVANSTNGAPQTVTKITDVMVEGLNGYEAVAYDVFYVSNAGAESGETIFDVTIS